MAADEKKSSLSSEKFQYHDVFKNIDEQRALKAKTHEATPEAIRKAIGKEGFEHKMTPFQWLHRSLFFLMCLCLPATVGFLFTSSMLWMSLCGAVQLMTWSYLLYKTTLVKSGHIMVIVDHISGKTSFGLDEGMYLLSSIYPTEQTEASSCNILTGDTILHRGNICLAHVPRNAKSIMMVRYDGSNRYLLPGLHILKVPTAITDKLTYEHTPLFKYNEPIKQFLSNHGRDDRDGDQCNTNATQTYLLRKDGLNQTYFVQDRDLKNLICIEHPTVVEDGRYDHIASLPPAPKILNFSLSLPIEVNNTDYILDVECGYRIDRPKHLIPRLVKTVGTPLTEANLQTSLTNALQAEMNGMVQSIFPSPSDSKDKAFDEISASIRKKAPNVVSGILEKWGVNVGRSDKESPSIQVRLRHKNPDNEQRRLDANSSELETVCATQDAKRAEIVAEMKAKNTEKAAQADAQAIKLLAQANAKALEFELEAVKSFCPAFVVAMKKAALDISPKQIVELAMQYLTQRSLSKAIEKSKLQSIGSNVLGNLGFKLEPWPPNRKAQPSSTDQKSLTMGRSSVSA